jgi:uncharacterized lipoprotein YbaY
LAVLGTAPLAQAQTDQRCFAETGFCIGGRIRSYWEENGGLPVFGFPITPQREERVENAAYQAQWFERNRLELHPENPRPYDVLLGRLGDARLRQLGRDWFTFPKADPNVAAANGCRYYAQTGHSICGDFLAAYQSYGLSFSGVPGVSKAESLALFGLPLSEPAYETLSDGRQYLVQWFERARFEHHPENNPPYTVLFGSGGIPGASVLRGTVSYSGPVAPPPNGVLEVNFLNLTQQSALVAQQRIGPGGWQVPFSFEIAYDPNAISQNSVYGIQARILVNGQVRFMNLSPVLVLTQGQPSTVQVVVTQL